MTRLKSSRTNYNGYFQFLDDIRCQCSQKKRRKCSDIFPANPSLFEGYIRVGLPDPTIAKLPNIYFMKNFFSAWLLSGFHNNNGSRAGSRDDVSSGQSPYTRTWSDLCPCHRAPSRSWHNRQTSRGEENEREFPRNVGLGNCYIWLCLSECYDLYG